MNFSSHVIRAKDDRRSLILSPREVQEIQERIGLVFRNPKFLNQAFIHGSVLKEAKRAGLESYERLEFLGDAVLELAVVQYLYRTYPEFHEGHLTALKGALVNTAMLGRLAHELNLDSYLRMSSGQKRNFLEYPRSRTYILGCVLEALIGAIYLDRGTGTVELFLGEALFPKLQEILRQELYLDAKSRLQQLVQERFHLTPHYEVLKEDHVRRKRVLVVGAYFGGRRAGEGKGLNRSEAEMAAAKDALWKDFQIKLNERVS